ncbi:GMC family oxidoreductase [Ideonella sp.]|uniref:GMC family oxidoreductase n=1 Tax=Ideonella sp. TaxID=1929293 RepID=UPI0035B3862D
MEFDYLVIGAGSAGSVLASRLSEDPQCRVGLVEAGPADRSVLIHCPAGLALLAKNGQANWGFETVPQPGLGGRRGYQPRGKVLGGSSSVNAMIYVRGQREDYDAWAAEGNPGWGFDDLLPYFLRAEDNARGASAWHGTGGPLHVMDLCDPNPHSAAFVEAGRQAGFPVNADFNGATQEGVGMYQVTHRRGERCSAAKAYLAPAVSRPNLTVITGAQALRVVLDGRRAVGVEVQRGGRRELLRARAEVLLSAGALQSPQLLMLSGIGPADELQRHGIAIAHALPGVGRNLHDHVDVVQVVDAPRITDLFGLSLPGAWAVWRGIGRWRRERRGLLTTNFAEAGGFLRTDPGEATPDIQLHFVIGKLVDHGRKTVFGHGYSCHVCLLRPRSRGTLTLASADPLAAPRIDPNFLGDDEDTARLVRGFKLMRRILQQPALAALGGRELATSAGAQTDAQIEAFVRSHADTIYHPVGTCRMGADDQAVVDARLRVRGLEGLRVVDASVMPRVVSGNTNAPVIAMAEKAVDLIRADARAAAPALQQLQPEPAAA